MDLHVELRISSFALYFFMLFPRQAIRWEGLQRAPPLSIDRFVIKAPIFRRHFMFIEP